jgi:DNA-binding response OmpR family regulator
MPLHHVPRIGAPPGQGVILDAAARELVVDGARVRLSTLEYEVLAYLREREGRPVPRAVLLRDVWGYAWSGGANVVDVAITSLRRKLGDRGVALETVRGVGYRLQSL